MEQRRNENPGEAEQGQQAWAKLIPEVEAAAQARIDPASDDGRKLALRWADLVNDFTRGNPGLVASLNKLKQEWPSERKRPYSDEADAFIKQAMKAGGIRCA